MQTKGAIKGSNFAHENEEDLSKLSSEALSLAQLALSLNPKACFTNGWKRHLLKTQAFLKRVEIHLAEFKKMTPAEQWQRLLSADGQASHDLGYPESLLRMAHEEAAARAPFRIICGESEKQKLLDELGVALKGYGASWKSWETFSGNLKLFFIDTANEFNRINAEHIVRTEIARSRDMKEHGISWEVATRMFGYSDEWRWVDGISHYEACIQKDRDGQEYWKLPQDIVLQLKKWHADLKRRRLSKKRIKPQSRDGFLAQYSPTSVAAPWK